MEDSSEVLNSSTNSNLRDLIMQKLAAAREQKLMQNHSTSHASPLSKTLPSAISAPWEEEKQLLLSMLEKSQSSANQSNNDRKILDSQISQLSAQVKLLQKENKQKKLELERLWNKKPGDRTESYLIEELKKLEKISDEREKQYQEEILGLKEQVLKKNESKENEMRMEIVKLEEKLVGCMNELKEKEKELERGKKTVKTGKTPQPIAQLLEMKAEKEKLERNLDRTIKMSCEKEAQLSDEIVKLKTINSQLIEQQQIKEKEFKEKISKNLQEKNETQSLINETVQKANNDKNYWEKEKKCLEQEKMDLQRTLENLRSELKQSEGFSSFYTLKSDLQRAAETISQQAAVIDQLKENSSHFLDMVPTKERSGDLKSIIIQMQKDFSECSQKSKASEELHIGELVQKNQEISILQSEISELRHKIVVFESKRYENELMLVRSDLHKAVAERAHAKKLIISYVRSVQQLEKMVHERQDIDSSQKMNSLEISRLNEENKSLLDAKLKQEEFFENEVKQLQGIIDGQCIKIQELENKIDAWSKIRLKENTDEMKSWIVKNRQLQELNRRIVENIGNVEMKPVNNPRKSRGSEQRQGIKQV